MSIVTLETEVGLEVALIEGNEGWRGGLIQKKKKLFNFCFFIISLSRSPFSSLIFLNALPFSFFAVGRINVFQILCFVSNTKVRVKLKKKIIGKKIDTSLRSIKQQNQSTEDIDRLNIILYRSARATKVKTF